MQFTFLLNFNYYFSKFLIILVFSFCLFQLISSQNTSQTDIISTTTTRLSTTTTARPIDGAVDMLAIYVPPGIGNAVKIVWGTNNNNNNNNNGKPEDGRRKENGKTVENDNNSTIISYGVYYGMDENELNFPKLTTTNQSCLIEDLEYCTRYYFAVTTLNNNGNGNGNDELLKINSNTMRTIITGIDQIAAPTNLTADFEPRAQPCLNIKWSSSCPNVLAPIGYVVSIFDKRISKYKVITLPRTKRSDFVYRLPVDYGDEYEIRVSTNFPGSKAIGPLKFIVPEPLQPFRVKVTVNEDDEAFLIYWTEPFIPLNIGKYYYQVFVYPGRDIDAPYEKYYVTRPVMVYKGELGQYSFSVNFASSDRKHISKATQPIYANLNGETLQLNLTTFSETPD